MEPRAWKVCYQPLWRCSFHDPLTVGSRPAPNSSPGSGQRSKLTIWGAAPLTPTHRAHSLPWLLATPDQRGPPHPYWGTSRASFWFESLKVLAPPSTGALPLWVWVTCREYSSGTIFGVQAGPLLGSRVVVLGLAKNKGQASRGSRAQVPGTASAPAVPRRRSSRVPASTRPVCPCSR